MTNPLTFSVIKVRSVEGVSQLNSFCVYHDRSVGVCTNKAALCVLPVAANRGTTSGTSQTGDALGKALASVS